MRPTQALHAFGQSLWLDTITRRMLDDGTLRHYIDELSVTGLTSNPTIYDRAISGSHDYDDAIRALVAQGHAGEEVLFALMRDDLARAADMLRPAHERSAGVDGWVSLEVSPRLAYDAAATLTAARQLFDWVSRPNLFIKIPGTPEGLPAIEGAIAAGVPVNVTLLFSPAQFRAAAEAFMRGLEQRVEQGLRPDVASVASVFVSRWDVAATKRAPALERNTLGIAVARRCYDAYRDLLDSPRWQRLEAGGARPQRLLWASTGTKDPAAPDTLYVAALAAPLTINTMPEETLLAFADHGVLGASLRPHAHDADAVIARFANAGVVMDEFAAELQRDGAAAFVRSWETVLASVAARGAADAAVS